MEKEEYLADVVTGRPHDLEIDGELLRLYPVTLAKTFELRRWLDQLPIDGNLMKQNPMLECLRLSEEHADAVAGYLAVHTSENSYASLYDLAGMKHRRELLLRVRRDELAGLLVSVLSSDHTEELKEELGISAERERLVEVLKVKEEGSKNSQTFGGRTLFGSFIDPLIEMGFSREEILYECGYDFLRMALADKVTSVYLSDEELERLPARAGGQLIDGDDASALAEISGMIGVK